MSFLKEKFNQSQLRFPDQIAIEVGKEQFSYNQLDQTVDKINGVIKSLQLQKKAIVVFNDHSFLSYASLLSVHFTNNTILPIEISWPINRVVGILKDVMPAALIISNNKDEIMNFIGQIEEFKNCYFIDAASGFLLHQPDQKALHIHTQYDEIAYIIFTSGSTGIPKGVPVKTESLDSFLRYFNNNYDFKENDRFLQVYDITFDVAYFSFLVPLCHGSCCCIMNFKKGVPKYLSIIDDLLTSNITVVSMVPTVLHFIKKYIKKYHQPSVRYSFFSGDALYHSDALVWREFVPSAAIHNFYGPTETTIVCTRYIWEEQAAAKESLNDIVPLGKPFPSLLFKIVDEANQAVPDGEVGNLSFSGDMVIDNYLNGVHPEKFFVDQYNEKRIIYYKTGDLASINEFGNIIFHGRIDHQVKINGYRIEISEVRLAIEKLTKLKCIVIKNHNEGNIDYLKAYIEGREMPVHKIMEQLKEYIPEYMIPTQYAFLPQFPLSDNNKIDMLQLQTI